MKKNLFAAVLISLALIFAGCTSSGTSSKDESSNSQSDQEQNQQPATLGVGDTASGEGYDITVNGARFSTAGALGTEPDNGKFVIFDVTISNYTDESETISTLLQFELQGSDYKKYDIALFAETDTTLGGTLSAGGKMRGEIAFDVPVLDSYTLIYKNDFLSDGVQFVIPSSEIN